MTNTLVENRKTFTCYPEVTIFLTKAISYSKFSAIDLTKDNDKPEQKLLQTQYKTELEELEKDMVKIKIEDDKK